MFAYVHTHIYMGNMYMNAYTKNGVAYLTSDSSADLQPVKK